MVNEKPSRDLLNTAGAHQLCMLLQINNISCSFSSSTQILPKADESTPRTHALVRSFSSAPHHHPYLKAQTCPPVSQVTTQSDSVAGQAGQAAVSPRQAASLSQPKWRVTSLLESCSIPPSSLLIFWSRSTHKIFFLIFFEAEYCHQYTYTTFVLKENMLQRYFSGEIFFFYYSSEPSLCTLENVKNVSNVATFSLVWTMPSKSSESGIS